MKTNESVRSSNPAANRRRFLKSAGLLALAAPAALHAGNPMPAPSQWWHCHGGLALAAEGKIPLQFVLPPMPADPNDPDPHADIKILFPMPGSKDRLLIEISVDIPGVPAPVTISHLEIELDAVVFGWAPAPSFILAGRVGQNSVSPFGNLIGAAASLSGGFTVAQDGAVAFQFLAASVAGNHTSIAPQATGVLKWRK
jgi:hypothetical protein